MPEPVHMPLDAEPGLIGRGLGPTDHGAAVDRLQSFSLVSVMRPRQVEG